MYKQLSNNVEIIITPQFINKTIDIYDETIISWKYKTFINNNSDYFLEISSEYIHIIDEFGKELSFSTKHSIKDSPLIRPQSNMTLNGYIPTLSESAIVNGYFTAFNELGMEIILEMPTFSLDSPDYKNLIIN